MNTKLEVIEQDKGAELTITRKQKRIAFIIMKKNKWGATIPCCVKNYGIGNCPCENCNQYLSKSDAYRIVEENR